METSSSSNIQTGDVSTITSSSSAMTTASVSETNNIGASEETPHRNQKQDEDHLLHKLEKEKRQRIKGDTAALPQIPQQNIDWCFQAREKYNVLPLKSWGQLPMNMIESWSQRQCDLAFTAARMSRKPLATCLGKTRHSSGTWVITATSPSIDGNNNGQQQSSKTGTVSTILTSLFGSRFSSSNSSSTSAVSKSTTSGSSTGSESYSDLKSLSLIAIMAASTTRKIKEPSTSNLALFTLMLPSLIRTLDCGFRYMYVLGFDKGDPFYDSDEVCMYVCLYFLFFTCNFSNVYNECY